ncbi:MAG TPA: hypothetical protein VFQ74_06060 [Pseudolysinimonas sp.]|nr:hypothetical protein [Pseudolysinimonas sp.]
MFKAIAAATATVALALGLTLVAVAPASAEGASNHESYYVTPNTSEVCVKWTPPNDSTMSVTGASFSIPSGATLTKIVVKAGSVEANGGPEDHGYYTNATYKYPSASTLLDWTYVSDLRAQTYTFTASNGQGRALSHVIYCYVPAVVTLPASGSVTAHDQVCTEYEVVGGSLDVTVSHASWVIKDSSDTTVASGSASQNVPLGVGTYKVYFTAETGYGLTTDSPITVEITDQSGTCGTVDTPVTPAAQATDQTCNTEDLENTFKVNGFITVFTPDKIAYTITADSDGTHTAIAYNSVTGKTDLLEPGDYTVHPEAQPGYTLSNTADLHVTIAATTDPCRQEITHATVDPSAVQQQLGCSTDGSYTLTTDQLNPDAVLWTVNGSPVSAGTYKVTTAGSFHVTAAPDTALGFGFAGDAEHQLLSWDFTFGFPATCDLKTLALTGTNDGVPLLAASGLLLLLGVALVRSGLRIRRRDAAAS